MPLVVKNHLRSLRSLCFICDLARGLNLGFAKEPRRLPMWGERSICRSKYVARMCGGVL